MTSEIKRVSAAAQRAARARAALNTQIALAHEAGASLRQIASAAELSVETTRTRIKNASLDASTTTTEGD